MSPRLALPADANPAWLRSEVQGHFIDGHATHEPKWTHRMPQHTMPRVPRPQAWGDMWNESELSTSAMPATFRVWACREEGCCYWMSADDLNEHEATRVEDMARAGHFWRVGR